MTKKTFTKKKNDKKDSCFKFFHLWPNFFLNVIFYSSDSLDEMNNKSKVFHVNLKKNPARTEKKKTKTKA